MQVKLRKEVAALLKDREDLEDFVNGLIVAYMDRKFIRKSDVAGTVITKPYRRSSFQSFECFDAVTHEFKGVAVEGIRESESLFIPSGKLYDLLHDHQVVLVMKSPRDEGISTKDPECAFVATSYDEMS